MVTVTHAYSEPINPAGSSPLLTLDQIWHGLERKSEQPEAFIPVISSAKILSREADGSTFVRAVTFKDEQGKPGREVRETIRKFYPAKVDFLQENGSLIQNIVSEGPSGEAHDYIMTFAFEWHHPEVAEGSEEHQKLKAQYQTMAKGAVHGTIVKIRELAQ